MERKTTLRPVPCQIWQRGIDPRKRRTMAQELCTKNWNWRSNSRCRSPMPLFKELLNKIMKTDSNIKCRMCNEHWDSYLHHLCLPCLAKSENIYKYIDTNDQAVMSKHDTSSNTRKDNRKPQEKNKLSNRIRRRIRAVSTWEKIIECHTHPSDTEL